MQINMPVVPQSAVSEFETWSRLKLTDVQRQLCEDAVSAFDADYRPQRPTYVVAPTGKGKTIVATFLWFLHRARNPASKLLFLCEAPRCEELQKWFHSLGVLAHTLDGHCAGPGSKKQGCDRSRYNLFISEEEVRSIQVFIVSYTMYSQPMLHWGQAPAEPRSARHAHACWREEGTSRAVSENEMALGLLRQVNDALPTAAARDALADLMLEGRDGRWVAVADALRQKLGLSVVVENAWILYEFLFGDGVMFRRPPHAGGGERAYLGLDPDGSAELREICTCLLSRMRGALEFTVPSQPIFGYLERALETGGLYVVADENVPARTLRRMAAMSCLPSRMAPDSYYGNVARLAPHERKFLPSPPVVLTAQNQLPVAIQAFLEGAQGAAGSKRRKPALPFECDVVRMAEAPGDDAATFHRDGDRAALATTSAGACRRLLHDAEVGHVCETFAMALGVAAGANVERLAGLLDRDWDLRSQTSSMGRIHAYAAAGGQYGGDALDPADIVFATTGGDRLLSAIFAPYLRPNAEAPGEALRQQLFRWFSHAQTAPDALPASACTGGYFRKLAQAYPRTAAFAVPRSRMVYYFLWPSVRSRASGDPQLAPLRGTGRVLEEDYDAAHRRFECDLELALLAYGRATSGGAAPELAWARVRAATRECDLDLALQAYAREASGGAAPELAWACICAAHGSEAAEVCRVLRDTAAGSEKRRRALVPLVPGIARQAAPARASVLIPDANLMRAAGTVAALDRETRARAAHRLRATLDLHHRLAAPPPARGEAVGALEKDAQRPDPLLSPSQRQRYRRRLGAPPGPATTPGAQGEPVRNPFRAVWSSDVPRSLGLLGRALEEAALRAERSGGHSAARVVNLAVLPGSQAGVIGKLRVGRTREAYASFPQAKAFRFAGTIDYFAETCRQSGLPRLVALFSVRDISGKIFSHLLDGRSYPLPRVQSISAAVALKNLTNEVTRMGSRAAGGFCRATGCNCTPSYAFAGAGGSDRGRTRPVACDKHKAPGMVKVRGDRGDVCVLEYPVQLNKGVNIMPVGTICCAIGCEDKAAPALIQLIGRLGRPQNPEPTPRSISDYSVFCGLDSSVGLDFDILEKLLPFCREEPLVRMAWKKGYVHSYSFDKSPYNEVFFGGAHWCNCGKDVYDLTHARIMGELIVRRGMCTDLAELKAIDREMCSRHRAPPNAEIKKCFEEVVHWGGMSRPSIRGATGCGDAASSTLAVFQAGKVRQEAGDVQLRMRRVCGANATSVVRWACRRQAAAKGMHLDGRVQFDFETAEITVLQAESAHGGPE